MAAPGEMAAQQEVAAQLEALTFGPGTAAPCPPGPREGEGGDEAVLPLGEAACSSRPAAAADSERWVGERGSRAALPCGASRGGSRPLAVSTAPKQRLRGAEINGNTGVWACRASWCVGPPSC